MSERRKGERNFLGSRETPYSKVASARLFSVWLIAFFVPRMRITAASPPGAIMVLERTLTRWFEHVHGLCVMLPAQQVPMAEGAPQATPCRVVSRVKIPPDVVFQLMRALSVNERLYEQRIGPIPRPGRHTDAHPE